MMVSGTETLAIGFTVNGRSVEVAGDPFRPLSAALRDDLGLTGTKVGCDAGDCGACTVLLDGAQACACLVPLGQVEGREVHTVEGAGPGGLTDRLRDAFLDHGAAQCGICTPGMLMASVDCLLADPRPSAAAVADALGGVLCRCTGYTKIVEAVLSVAEGRAVPASEATGPVGASIARVDGRAKVDGTDRFGADHAPAGALWLRVVRSPHDRAAFTIGDLSAVVARTPGLVAILTARDVPGENRFGVFPAMRDQPVFADHEVRFRGEAIAALVGDRAAVETVSDADLPITWTPLPALLDPVAAIESGATVLHPARPGNVLAKGRLRCGDGGAGHAGAAVSADGRFRTGYVEHAYIEPEAGYAIPHGLGVDVAACTQSPYLDRDETAVVLGVPPEAVRIRPTACGGGFGGKLDPSVQPFLAVAARVTGRPVRMIYTRAESMASTTKRHPSDIRARYSADADGRFRAFSLEGDFETGAYASWGPTVANRVPVHATGPYRVPHVETSARAIHTHRVPAGAFRGFGVPQAAIAHETLIDDLADRLGIDRLEIRRLNAIGRGDTTATGQVLASGGLPQCLDALRPAWTSAVAAAKAHNAKSPRHRRGVGIACMWYGCGNTSLPNPSTMRITLSRDGALTFWNGAVDIGQGSTTVLTQIAAEALGLPVAAFGVVVGDTALTEDAGKTSASRQTLVSGNAARLAAGKLRSEILSLANAGPDARLALEGSRLVIIDGDAGRTIDLSALPAEQDGIVLTGLATWDPPTTPLDADGQGVPYVSYGFAAQMAEVEVDTELATVRVLAIHAAHDVGRAINPALVEGQIQGGIAQGLGLALMEEYVPGRTENLHDYLIPTVGDVPPITIHLIEDPEPDGPFGAKGVGEPALIATAPAILGAIRHATGVRVDRVPVLPHRLWQAMAEARP
jgi:CO/xanthine dehydrogenase Mo-binding subunit/aerobic-type carbon monoxide dehydrogenase small subunit (CoxS/CutS family)